jgi:hypothetical protein
MFPVPKVSNRTISFEYGGSIFLYIVSKKKAISVGCSPMFDSVHPKYDGQIVFFTITITVKLKAVFLGGLRLSGHKA